MPRIPIIAIVGRPNVGKSTLFNRLTGRRAALVSDMPGLTRDRREGEADIAGRTCRVIDTAGLEEAAAGSIAARMRSQSELAIRGADVVLFVIDARTGITPTDRAFADVVRRAARPAILVANKCEGRGGEAGFYEAFELGLGEPVAISAEHAEGISDLEQQIAEALTPEPTAPDEIDRDANAETLENGADGEDSEARGPIRIAIIGRPNAGKSTLVNALLGEQRMITGPEPGLTRDAVATDFEWQGRQMRLFDTAGLRRKARVTEAAEKLAASDAVRAMNFADVVVLLVDAEAPFEHQDLTLADIATKEGRALVLAVNKWDLVTDKQKRLAALRELVAEKLAQVPGVALVPVSALAERGLDKLMQAIVRAYALWNTRISTPQLNRWLAEALARHAPPLAQGRRIKIRYMTQAATRPPTFVAFSSRAQDLPGAYVRYLVNSLRETFELPGVPIRFKLRGSRNPYADRD